MSEHNYNFHDDSFSLDKAQDYTLLIQISGLSFSYAITNGDQLVAWAENHPLDELSNPQELLDLLSAKYKQVVIGLPASGFTLVPKSLYNPEQLSGIARFLDVYANEKVLAQPLDNENIIVYKTAENIVNAAEEFGLHNTTFTSKGWITAIAQSDIQDKTIYLNIENNKAEFLYFSDATLLFYNAFEFNGQDELSYYAALVATELNLEPKYTTLLISGDVNPGDKNISRLAEFFLKAELNTLQVLQLPQEIVPHKVLSISALSLCVSSEVV